MNPVQQEIVNAIDKRNLFKLNKLYPMMTKTGIWLGIIVSVLSIINTAHDIWKWVYY